MSDERGRPLKNARYLPVNFQFDKTTEGTLNRAQATVALDSILFFSRPVTAMFTSLANGIQWAQTAYNAITIF